VQISTVRSGIAAWIAAHITDDRLTCYGFMPKKVVYPAYCVGEVDLDLRVVMARKMRATISTYVFTGDADYEAAQSLLDGYISLEGAGSILVALWAGRARASSPAMDGLVDTCSVTDVTGYRLYPLGETMSFGAQIMLDVVGRTATT
jgi:hypothetical protein